MCPVLKLELKKALLNRPLRSESNPKRIQNPRSDTFSAVVIENRKLAFSNKL